MKIFFCIRSQQGSSNFELLVKKAFKLAEIFEAASIIFIALPSSDETQRGPTYRMGLTYVSRFELDRILRQTSGVYWEHWWFLSLPVSVYQFLPEYLAFLPTGSVSIGIEQKSVTCSKKFCIKRVLFYLREFVLSVIFIQQRRLLEILPLFNPALFCIAKYELLSFKLFFRFLCFNFQQKNFLLFLNNLQFELLKSRFTSFQLQSKINI